MSATEDKLARMLDKIAKLLAKAESSTFPAEAEAFTEHAERLMVRYGIGKAEVDAERGRQGQTREPIVEKHLDLDGTYRHAALEGLQWVLAAYSTVTTLQAKGKAYARLFIIGAESDVAQMSQLAESLRIQEAAAMRAWWANQTSKAWMTQAEQRRERREFIFGFYRGASVRLRQIVGEEAGGGKELVLVARKARADEWIGEQYPELKPARAVRLERGSRDAKAAGERAGLTADVNGRKIGAQRVAGAVSA
jgi:hypothetical protein